MEAAPLTPETPDRTWIAREANAHIREMASALDALVASDREIGFFCECGCLETAATTLAKYNSEGGAWIEGHAPK
jgi:hypothetical protein